MLIRRIEILKVYGGGLLVLLLEAVNLDFLNEVLQTLILATQFLLGIAVIVYTIIKIKNYPRK